MIIRIAVTHGSKPGKNRQRNAVNVAVDTGNVNVVSTSYPNRWHITGEIAAYYTNGVMNKLLLGDSAQVTLNYTL